MCWRIPQLPIIVGYSILSWPIRGWVASALAPILALHRYSTIFRSCQPTSIFSSYLTMVSMIRTAHENSRMVRYYVSQADYLSFCYCTTHFVNSGIATILGSVLAYGFGHIESSSVQLSVVCGFTECLGKRVSSNFCRIFLFAGIATVVTVPFVYWKMDNTIMSARFICDEDKPKAIQHLRANQTRTGTS